MDDPLWSSVGGFDSATSYDDTTTYDDTQGGEVFWGAWLGAALMPKTDWIDVINGVKQAINFSDFNRIEQNMIAVRQLLTAIYYVIPTLTTVTNRDKTYIDFLSGINRIENNLEAMRTNFITPSGYLPAESWTVGKGFDYSDANRIESDIRLLYQYGDLVYGSFRYCGSATCGEQGVIY